MDYLNRITRHGAFKYIFIVVSIFLFMGPPCKTTSTSSKWDPLMGTLTNSSGQRVPGAIILNSSISPYPDGSLSQNDSTQSLTDGSYVLSKGIANYYSESTIGCDKNPQYLSMATFYLICIHPSYDTTVAAFIDSSLFNYYSPIYADTMFVLPAAKYGDVGSLRRVPTIVMKSKNYESLVLSASPGAFRYPSTSLGSSGASGLIGSRSVNTQ